MQPLALTTVISGGQTGADIAAVRAAQQLKLKTGGHVPLFYETWRMHKYGFVKINKPVDGTEMSAGDQFALRSRLNVDNSDGTLAFRTHASVGTDKTIAYALRKKWEYPAYLRSKNIGVVLPPTTYKPLLLIANLKKEGIEQEIREWLQRHNIRVLNVAGHRDEALEEGVYDLLLRTLEGRVGEYKAT
jgi:hypothetical protein